MTFCFGGLYLRKSAGVVAGRVGKWSESVSAYLCRCLKRNGFYVDIVFYIGIPYILDCNFLHP